MPTITNTRNALADAVRHVVNTRCQVSLTVPSAMWCEPPEDMNSPYRKGMVEVTDWFVVDTEGPFLYIAPTPDSTPHWCFSWDSIETITYGDHS
jgi:hypothetical protein